MSVEKKIASIRVVKPGSSPDVDSDFNTKVHDKVIEHVTELYGKDNVANIVTFNKFAAKKAFKAMCTIYQIPYASANKISNLIPPPIEGVDCTIEDIFNPESDRYAEGSEFRNATAGSQWESVIEGAKAIEKRTSSIGTHACGLIVSDKPLHDTIPLLVRQDDERVITQWSYPECEALGLVKMDFLGLDTVDLIQNTVEYIMRSGKTPPNMLDIIHGPMDDKKTFELLQRGDTIGIFQLASPGVQDLLRRMQPTTIDDIAATTALYRPGPMGMQSHTHYAERKSGREEVETPIHEEFANSPLEEILNGTQNLCVYQEQVMQIANRIAGMSLQEGDDLRRAMGKKKKSVMDEMKVKFFEGARSNGYSDEAITDLWDTVAEFAGYGFNRSHAYGYAVVAYQAAYLKANYPTEFMAALLEQNLGDKEKILIFLKETRKMGLKVGTVDVNNSEVSVMPNLSKGEESPYDIVYGFSGVNSVSEDVASEIVAERNENGEYTSVEDMIRRCSKRGISRRNIFENLAYAGAFDNLNITRKGAVELIPHLLSDAKKTKSHGASLFDMFATEDDEPMNKISISDEEYSFTERLRKEANVIGLYLTSHPLARIGHSVPQLRDTTISKLLKENKRNKVRIAASITDMEAKTHKRGKSIMVTLDDGTGYLQCRMGQNIVKGIDKWKNQQTVKRLYINGESNIKADLHKSLDNSDITAIPEPEKNRVYMFDITYSPSYDDGAPRVQVNTVLPVNLSDDGKLPVRLRFDESDNSKAANKLKSKLPQALAKKYPGDYPIMTTVYNSNEQHINAIEPDQVYLDAFAVIEADSDESTSVDDEYQDLSLIHI